MAVAELDESKLERHQLGHRAGPGAGEPLPGPDGPRLLDVRSGDRPGRVVRLPRASTLRRSTRLFEEAAVELDPARAALIYQQIDRLLWQAMPAVPLFAEPTLLANEASLSGVQADAGGAGPLWGAANWARLGPVQLASKR